MMVPGITTDLIGLFVLVSICYMQHFQKKKMLLDTQDIDETEALASR